MRMIQYIDNENHYQKGLLSSIVFKLSVKMKKSTLKVFGERFK